MLHFCSSNTKNGRLPRELRVRVAPARLEDQDQRLRLVARHLEVGLGVRRLPEQHGLPGLPVRAEVQTPALKSRVLPADHPDRNRILNKNETISSTIASSYQPSFRKARNLSNVKRKHGWYEDAIVLDRVRDLDERPQAVAHRGDAGDAAIAARERGVVKSTAGDEWTSGHH